MQDADFMPFLGFIAASSRAPEEPVALMRKGARLAMVTVGLAIMLIGVPLALLPWLHLPGILVLATGLVIVLRNSFSARRTFIRAQRRHPKIVFPIRRLIRREPEVVPVAWQQSLRFERLVVPRRFRFLRRTRLTVMRRRRR
jgi:hypothetical protein